MMVLIQKGELYKKAQEKIENLNPIFKISHS